MNRILNKYAAITLDTGIGVKGIITFWSEDEVVVGYHDSDNYTIILNPQKNIKMVSVYAEQSAEYASDVVEATDKEPEYDRIVEPDPPELQSYEPDPTLRAKKIAELRIEHKEAVKDQLKLHFKNKKVYPRKATYGYPDFTK